LKSLTFDLIDPDPDSVTAESLQILQRFYAHGSFEFWYYST